MSRLTAAKQEFHEQKEIEAKIVSKSNLHDRFYIINNSQVWVIGTSYDEAAGSSPTTICRITDDKEIKKAILYFDTAWENATAIESSNP